MLNYKNVLDSVPQLWVIELLHVAKVPATSCYSKCQISLATIKTSIVTKNIKLSTSQFLDDTLSVMMFVLEVNVSSVLLPKYKVYILGSARNNIVNVTYFFC